MLASYMVKLKYMIYEMSIISDMFTEEFPFSELPLYFPSDSTRKGSNNRWAS